MADKYDFSGYATKANLLCSDGRRIMKDCFKNDSGRTVPLVWQHMHNSPDNVLGHCLLENVDDGVIAYGKFNNSEMGKKAKLLVEHGDINAMSIWANQLKQIGADVMHGVIKEVSLVLAGANPGALIDNVSISHSDGTMTESEEDAIIYTGEEIAIGDVEHEDKDTSNTEDPKEIFNTLTDKQKDVVYAIVGSLLENQEGESESEAEQADDSGESFHEEEKTMKVNVFEQGSAKPATTNTLSHSDFDKINEEAKRCGSFRQAYRDYIEANHIAHGADNRPAEAPGTAGTDYGISNLDVLFPEYRNISETPEVIKRDDAWVASVIGGARKVPFAKIRTMTFDITEDTARARGYKKGHLKKEEVIKMAKRTTGPCTIYKKQRLDRDDIIDITSFDVVSFLKREMQGMLREEIARQILISDMRDGGAEDKIDNECLRPIYKEAELYAYHTEVTIPEENPNDTNANDWVALIDSIRLAMVDYNGSGSPTLFMTKENHTKLRMIRDRLGRKLYDSDAALADALDVDRIVDVPVMKDVKSENGKKLFGIIVDMRDYTIGTNRGGETTFFDDFDIDYNQYKYLYETRLSGALTRTDSAVILETKANP